MTDSQNTSSSGWKKTVSLACIGAGGLLIAVGNLFGGSLDLSAGLVQVFDAVAAVLGAFGVGTLAAAKKGASDGQSADTIE